MQNSESSISEIVSTALVVLLGIAFTAINGAIFFGWAVSFQKKTNIVTQAFPTTIMITNASIVRIFMSQEEPPCQPRTWDPGYR